MISLDLQQWVNRTEVQFDEATLAPAAMLAATLGRQDKFETGSVLPPYGIGCISCQRPRTTRSEETGILGAVASCRP